MFILFYIIIIIIIILHGKSVKHQQDTFNEEQKYRNNFARSTLVWNLVHRIMEITYVEVVRE
jgi:hypothetical protein